MSDLTIIKTLVVTVAVLLGMVVGLIAAILSRIGRSPLPVAIRHGAVSFGGTITLIILIMSAVGVL